MPGRTRHYASPAAKQAAYRRRKTFRESDTARLIALHAVVGTVACGPARPYASPAGGTQGAGQSPDALGNACRR